MSRELEVMFDTLSVWHGQLMPVRTAMQMLIATITHSSEGAQFQACIELANERLVRVLDEMDRASLLLAQQRRES